MTTNLRPNEGPGAQIAIFWIVGFPSKKRLELEELGAEDSITHAHL